MTVSKRMRFLFRGLACLLIGAASPSFAATSCGPLKQIASIPLGSLPSGRVTLPVKINGRPSNLLFDTGGAARALSAELVSEMKLRTVPSEIKIRNIAGKRSEQEVTVDFAIGDSGARKIRFLVMPPAGGEAGSKRATDGIFAPEIINAVDFDLDFAAGKLGLFQQDHCPGKVVYWPATAVAIIPYQLDYSNHYRLPVTLDGRNLDAVLDTGATNTLLNLDDARASFGVDTSAPDVKKVGEISPGHDTYERQFKTLSFEGVAVANPIMTLVPNLIEGRTPTGSHVIDRSTTLPQLILGMNLLRKLHIYVAQKERKIYITPAGAPPS